MQNINIEPRSGWNFNRWIVLFILGAFAGLLIEIRYTHRYVLGEHPLSFTPLVYSGLMIIAGITALVLWDKGGRKVLFWCFAVGLLVGPLGLWLHTGHHPIRGLGRELSAWQVPLHGADEIPDDHPPVLAPLSFFGLGLLGMLACAEKFQQKI